MNMKRYHFTFSYFWLLNDSINIAFEANEPNKFKSINQETHAKLIIYNHTRNQTASFFFHILKILLIELPPFLTMMIICEENLYIQSSYSKNGISCFFCNK